MRRAANHITSCVLSLSRGFVALNVIVSRVLLWQATVGALVARWVRILVPRRMHVASCDIVSAEHIACTPVPPPHARTGPFCPLPPPSGAQEPLLPPRPRNMLFHANMSSGRGP